MSGAEDLKAFTVDPLAFGGLGGPPLAGTPVSAPAAPAAKKGEAAKGGGYPTIEGLLNDKAKLEAFNAASAASVKKLEEIAAKGSSAQDKADARRALLAFEHTRELIAAGEKLTAKIQKEHAEKIKARAQGKK